MKNKINRREKKPIWVGTGLVALDVIIDENNGEPQKVLAGGSCGNISAIISYLGFDSYPIARLKKNLATKLLIDDLRKFKVKQSLITETDDGSTPIIIQRIKKDKSGNPIHRFEFKDPESGAWLPSYKPVLSANVPTIVKTQKLASVFYFDRINRGSIDFAKYYKSQGALIYFEPSSVGEIKLFEECLQIADVVKFSTDRITNYEQLFPKQKVALEIQTLGKDGVRFRFNHNLKAKSWVNSKGNLIENILDASGAGDWLSAGILLKIGSNGVKGFKEASKEEILEAIKYGQTLGALNCLSNGARGLMYTLTLKELDRILGDIQTKIDFSYSSKKNHSRANKTIAIKAFYK